jgi:hypothetical protein
MEKEIVEIITEKIVDNFCVVFKAKKFLNWAIVDVKKLKFKIRSICSEFMEKLVKHDLKIYDHEKHYKIFCENYKKSSEHFTFIIEEFDEDAHYEEQLDIFMPSIKKLIGLIYTKGIEEIQEEYRPEMKDEIEDIIRENIDRLPFIYAKLLRE